MNCYNCEYYLREALDSVYAQTLSDWEIVFWDNASSDRSGEIAQSYDKRLRYFHAEENVRLGEARKLAIAQAKGLYLAFLDCDDSYFPAKLEHQVNLMQERDLVFSYGSVEIMDEKGRRKRVMHVQNHNGYLLEPLLYKYEINMQTVMMKRVLLAEDWCYFDGTLSYSPDYNLFMRIAARYPIGVIHEVLARYRVFQGSLSHRMLGVVAKEMKFTLDLIFSDNEVLQAKMPEAVSYAYSKLEYYDAIYDISENRYSSAINRLKKVYWISFQFFSLYVLALMRLPRSLILRLLRR